MSLFQILAIAVLAVFYGCYLFKMFSQKKAGIQTDQMGKGKMGISKWIEIIMKLSTYLTVFVEVVSIVLNTQTENGMIQCTGFILCVIGDLFFVITVYTMKDSWRAGVPDQDETSLVTSGIFKISRNPAFLGFDLVYIGIVCMFFNIGLLCVSVCSILLLDIQIRKNEEPFLESVFKEEYRQYKSKVNRYLGRH